MSAQMARPSLESFYHFSGFRVNRVSVRIFPFSLTRFTFDLPVNNLYCQIDHSLKKSGHLRLFLG